MSNTIYTQLICQFCNKECKNTNSLKAHTIRCKWNYFTEKLSVVKKDKINLIMKDNLNIENIINDLYEKKSAIGVIIADYKLLICGDFNYI